MQGFKRIYRGSRRAKVLRKAGLHAHAQYLEERSRKRHDLRSDSFTRKDEIAVMRDAASNGIGRIESVRFITTAKPSLARRILNWITRQLG